MITKKQAFYEFGMNLIEQKKLTLNQFLKNMDNFSWRLFQFEIGYWIQELKQ